MSFIRRNWRVITLVSLALLFCYSVSLAIAVDRFPDQQQQSIEIPSQFWAIVAAGVVQGLIWYGAINSKLNTLAERMVALEKRYDSLLKIFIDSITERKNHRD